MARGRDLARIAAFMPALGNFTDALVGIDRRLSRIERSLERFIRDEEERDRMAQQDIENLKRSVEQVKTVAGSAKTLIEGLAQALKDAGDNPQEIQAIIADLDAKSSELAAAVAANTPAQNEPTPPPA